MVATPPQAGDRYVWSDCNVTVSRVSSTGDWADVRVLQTSTGTTWTKRQKLPFPPDFIRVTPEVKSLCEGCGADEVEPGLPYCMDCVDVLAQTFAHKAGED